MAEPAPAPPTGSSGKACPRATAPATLRSMEKPQSKWEAFTTPTAPGFAGSLSLGKGWRSVPPLHPPRKARAGEARQEWQP